MPGQIPKRILATAYVALTIIFLTIGCSSGNITEPGTASPAVPQSSGCTTHQLWGLYNVTVNFNAKTIDFLPLRQAEMRLNALPFLEPPPLENLTVSNLQIIPPSPLADGRVLCDVHLTNPHAGLTQFTGFDVKGIVFGPSLDNPDGKTRWWNPVEFTGSGIMGFTPGLLGHPEISEFEDILNDYKYFSTGLGTNDIMTEDSVISSVYANRGHFPAGDTLSRHYEINFGQDPGDFLVFQYAVDASWKKPVGTPPYELEDFPIDANQPEAWLISTIEIENTLNYYNGEGTGDLTLYVNVYDWQGNFPDTNVTLSCYEPDVFDPVTVDEPFIISPTYAKFEINVTDATPNHAGFLPLLIAVESTDVVYGQGNPWGTYPAGNVTAYWDTEVFVDNQPPGATDCEGTLHANDPGGNAWTTGLLLDADGTSPVWDMAFQTNGPYAGNVIYPFKQAGSNDGKVTALRYYDADSPIDNPTSGTFYQFPVDDYCDWVWSVDCGATEGRVAYVGSNKPDTFIALNNEGTKLSEVKVGANTIAIQAMCFDEFDQLWVLSLHTTMFEPTWQLRYFAQVDGPPFYMEAVVVDLSPYYPFSLLSFIYDMDYSFQSKRLYVFDMDGGTFDDNMGSIDIFDIGPAGIPVHNPDASLETIFPTAVDLLPEGGDGRHHWYWHVAWGGDIVIDHSAGTNERCRITCMAILDDDSSDDTTDNFWMLFDEDLVMFDSFHEPYTIADGDKCWDTFAINPDENRNIAAMKTNATWEYAPKPVGW